jgi:hypothetical protein
MRLILGLALLFAALASGSYLLFQGALDPAADIVQAEIAGAHFSFPAGYARDESTAVGGFTDRLAFVALFPEFSPPTRTDAKSASHRARDTVFVTLSAKDDTLDPADRPARLYARFLQAEAEAGPAGLILRRFEKGSPYEVEELYLAPPDGKEFFARCPKTPLEEGAPGEACLFVFRIGGLDVELRFPPSLLDHWEALNEGARSFVARLRARKKQAAQ